MPIQSAEKKAGVENKRAVSPDLNAGSRGALGGDVLACGFGMTVAAWIMAYISRIPMFPTPAPGQVTILLMLAMVFAGGFLAARYSTKGVVAAVLAGLLSGLLNILVLGSVLHDMGGGAGANSVAPAAGLWIGGSILLNGVVAGFGGVFGGFFPAPGRETIRWTAVFALILTAATLPLITAGGLVTAYGVGMAVPDWPQSYGYNMFLFPLSKMQSAQGNFYEHAHRLLGSLVGLTSLTLAAYLFFKKQPIKSIIARSAVGLGSAVLGFLLVVVTRQTALFFIPPAVVFIYVLYVSIKYRGWNCLFAWLIFGAVCVQGLLGGLRVTENSIPLATIHGIFAQIVFAGMACLTAACSRSFTLGLVPAQSTGDGSADRAFAGTLLAALILQLALGALVRQRFDALLLIHITLAAGVALLALACGFRAWALHRALVPLKRTGMAVMTLVGIQLCLGIVALALRPFTPTAAKTTASALWTTAHQANGALLLALCAVLYLWNWRLLPVREATSNAALEAVTAPE